MPHRPIPLSSQTIHKRRPIARIILEGQFFFIIAFYGKLLIGSK